VAQKRITKPYSDLRAVEKLLDKQTTVILSAVDEKIGTLEKRIASLEKRIVSLEKRIARLEIKVDQRFDQLITTLDKFLKRLTNIEDELEIMKLDINRLKKVIKEKLGVDLT